MTDSNERKDGAAEQKCSPAGSVMFLLLLVGFVFGVATGFYTKDSVMRTYSTWMNSMKQKEIDKMEEAVVTGDIPAQFGASTAPQGEQPDADKAAEEGEKKDEEKKDEVIPAFPAPAPAQP